MELFGYIGEPRKKPNGILTKSEFRIHYFGMELLRYIEAIQKKRNGIRTKSEFGIHYFGMELFGCIERIKKNEREYEQHLNLGSITLAWSSLDTLRESRKKTKWNTNKT